MTAKEHWQLVDSTRRTVQQLIRPLLNGKKRATKYLSPSLTIKGTRRHKSRLDERNIEIVLTVGPPNYAEREFIKKAQRAGEPFPIRNVQMRNWPAPRS